LRERGLRRQDRINPVFVSVGHLSDPRAVLRVSIWSPSSHDEAIIKPNNLEQLLLQPAVPAPATDPPPMPTGIGRPI